MDCCREAHQAHPFHRIEVWQNTHFSPAWLWQTGVSIHLGHAGNACPSNAGDEDSGGQMEELPTPTLSYVAAPTEFDDADDEIDDPRHEYSWSDAGGPSKHSHPGSSVVVVVHTNAVHHLRVFPCTCPNAPAMVQQYLRMGFYPSTYKEVETVFTFQVLDDHLMENLECQTSAHHYYSKLRRMTNKIFPQTVAVCFLS